MIVENNLQTSFISKDLPNIEDQNPSILLKSIRFLFWFLFVTNISVLSFFYPTIPEINIGGILQVNGFTILIWTVVTFFSALISSYSDRYLKGFKYQNKFMLLCVAFTFAVMLFVMSNNVIVSILSWFFMGVFMSRLIGVDSSWGEAREASKYAQKYFLGGAILLAMGLLILAYTTESFLISEITSKISSISYPILLIASLCVITAAIIQSAIYPFHRWLLSAMTSPTPASALMHAGFVNGSGILLTIFASLIFASNTQDFLLIIGGLTAILAQFTKLIQVNVKQKLACSTIAQMGFMIMQCGLGFYNAAVVHLILHGFYKAYLFLSSGEEIKQSIPKKPTQLKIKPLQALAVLLFGTLGALFFSFITGKELQLNSGIFLILIVAITVGQITYNIVKEKSLSNWQKFITPIILFLAGITAYGLMYNSVSAIMSAMPMVAQSMPLSVLQITFGVVFLFGFFIMKLGLYQKIPWLYVKLMNVSQPYKKTVVMYKSNL